MDPGVLTTLGSTVGVMLAMLAITAYLKQEIREVRSDLTEEVREVRSDLRTVDDRVRDLQVDMGIVKSDIRDLQVDMGIVKSDIRDLQVDMGIVKHHLRITSDDPPAAYPRPLSPAPEQELAPPRAQAASEA